MKPHTALSALLVALGNVQMIGDLTGNRIIKGVGAALHASPAAKVFTAQDGLETFSAQFYVEWQAPDGGLRSVQLTPSLYSHVRGPYNRRNIYGAAIAGGPFLARQDWGHPMLASVSQYAFCAPGVLRNELALPSAQDVAQLTVRVEPRDARTRAADAQFSFPITCAAPKESSL